MARVLLGVTGSVAAIRTPALLAQLRHAGHDVKVVATQAALYFFDPAELAPSGDQRRGVLIVDEDEWPGRAEGRRYQRGDPVVHIELRRWAEVLVIAPLDANTLAKLACGLADNCLTCVWRAWESARPVILAPAMNTLMWEHPLTRRHLAQLAADSGLEPPAGLDRDGVIAWINAHCRRLRIVPPQAKALACGDVGMGAMAEVEAIVAAVNADLGIPDRHTGPCGPFGKGPPANVAGPNGAGQEQ
ncbi:MAG: phosphopantothenoylcysteine decarboxylase [Gemmataceae bacterium]|nr:phosphopantothenoylcysteine decarboxylase [Gemmataceae bacterium]MDW8267281.1 flavoprotein [Gemmataceae bacterium]